MKPPLPSPLLRLGLLLLLAVAVAVTSPLVGSHPISPGQVWAGDATAATIIWQLRLPRVLLAFLAGGVLAVSGLSLQTLFRNPLAEPYTLGVASGAALGVAAVVIAGGSAAQATPLPLTGVASFLGALGAAALVATLAGRPRGWETSTLLLAGIAVALTCQALILFLQYLADATETLRMVRWMMGGLVVVGYREVAWLLPFAAAGVMVLLARRWELDLLLAGEEIALSRGVDVGRTRLLLLAANSLMVGAMVAVTGPIGFVGLMVPHMLRRWVGHHHLYLLPACLLGGGSFLALCDLIARLVLAPAELPVGIVTALLGGPFFLWLLRRRDS